MKNLWMLVAFVLLALFLLRDELPIGALFNGTYSWSNLWHRPNSTDQSGDGYQHDPNPPPPPPPSPGDDTHYPSASVACHDYCTNPPVPNQPYGYGVDRETCMSYEDQVTVGSESCCCGNYYYDMENCAWDCLNYRDVGGFYDPVGWYCWDWNNWMPPCCCEEH